MRAFPAFQARAPYIASTTTARFAVPRFAREFTRDFLRLDGSGARYIVSRGIRTFGIDYLSVGDHEAHRELLGAGVVPVEGLDLREIEPGSYTFICLPIDLVGSDGAPARAILID